MAANNAGTVIRNLLANNAGVAALVGARIYPNQAPDEADLPLIVYGVRLQDEVDGSAPVGPAAVDVHCYGASDDSAHAVAVAADGALAGVTSSSSGTQVQSLVREDWEEIQDFEMGLYGSLLRFGAVVVRG